MNCSCGQSREELWEKWKKEPVKVWPKVLSCRECRIWIASMLKVEKEAKEPSTTDYIRWGEHKKGEV